MKNINFLIQLKNELLDEHDYFNIFFSLQLTGDISKLMTFKHFCVMSTVEHITKKKRLLDIINLGISNRKFELKNEVIK